MTPDDRAEIEAYMTRKRAKAKKPRILSTWNALAAALGVTRQTLHEWRRTTWWPLTQRPPFDDDDVATVHDAHLAASSNGGSSADVSDDLKRAQTVKAQALAIRYQRQSAVELADLIPASAFERFIRSIAGDGGASMVALQAIYWRLADATFKYLQAQGIDMSNAQRSQLDNLLRATLGNPVGEVAAAALKQLSEHTPDDDPLTPLVDQCIAVNAELGITGPLEAMRDDDPVEHVDAAVTPAEPHP